MFNIDEIRNHYGICNTDEYLLVKVAQDYCLSDYLEIKKLTGVSLFYRCTYYLDLMLNENINENIRLHEAGYAKKYYNYIKKYIKYFRWEDNKDIKCLILLLEMNKINIEYIDNIELKQKIIEELKKKNKKRPI